VTTTAVATVVRDDTLVRRAVARLAAAWPCVPAVAAPSALFGWRAMRAPISFDGGMNLQVAERLANGQGYTRFYGEVLTYPHEVQTNGPYMYVAALAIRLFGGSQFGYQLANLVFVAAFAAVVYLLLRQHAVLRIVGPSLVLLGVPQIAGIGLGGMGEVPTSAFLFGAVLALVEAVRSPQQAPWWVLGASLSYGAAIATKTFAIGAMVAFAVGLLCVLVGVTGRRPRWQVMAAAAGVALAPAVQEVHRLVSLGSLGGYRAWWNVERNSVEGQSGLGRSASGGPIQTVRDRIDVLSDVVDFPPALLAAVLVMPLLWVVGLLVWRWRGQGLRRTVTDPSMVLPLVLGTLVVSYVGWWLLLLPDGKLWVRRMAPGLLALHLLYLLLVAWSARVGPGVVKRHWGERSRSRTSWVVALGAVGAMVVLVGTTTLPYAWGRLQHTTQDLVNGQQHWLEANREAAAYVEQHDEHRFHGDGWWSAPVVSLMSGTGFHRLDDLDPDGLCSLDPARDRVVWDHDAKGIGAPEPHDRDGTLAFEAKARFDGFVTIYAVGPAPGRCH
jgi:hypothetical protein